MARHAACYTAVLVCTQRDNSLEMQQPACNVQASVCREPEWRTHLPRKGAQGVHEREDGVGHPRLGRHPACNGAMEVVRSSKPCHSAKHCKIQEPCSPLELQNLRQPSLRGDDRVLSWMKNLPCPIGAGYQPASARMCMLWSTHSVPFRIWNRSLCSSHAGDAAASTIACVCETSVP